MEDICQSVVEASSSHLPPSHICSVSQVRLMISDSDLSDEFSLDTVGSYGDVKCKGRHKDYLVRC